MRRIWRGLLAVAIAIAVFGNLVRVANTGTLNPINYFSYFTILSNIAACALFAVQAIRNTTFRPATRGAVTLYMTVTGIVDNVLLAGVDVLTPPWVDLVVHIVAPLAVLGDWVIHPPSESVGARTVSRWLIFPIVWVVYTMIRGVGTGWYPYPFLDPGEVGGYGVVAGYAAGITIAFGAVGWGLSRVASRGRFTSAGG